MDVLIIGFALFAMFFGAGNLIFPPMLGFIYGDQWLVSGLAFILSGVGLTLLAVVSMAKKKGSVSAFVDIAGKKIGLMVIIIISLAIGPLGAIPRTGALSSEITQSAGVHIPTVAFVLVFFILTLVFSITESKVIDIIGKYLTPILLLVLAIMIVKGILNPTGGFARIEQAKSSIFANSMIEGYNTMDSLAAIAFTPIIVKAVIDKGHEKSLVKTTLKASVIAVLGLSLVYLSLTYLGSRMSLELQSDTSRVELLTAIASSILGDFGKYILSSIITLACFTTSIGLTTSISNIFEELSNGKIKYKVSVIAITIISFILSLGGVDTIIEYVNPLLNFIYPIVIIMIIFNIYNRPIDKRVRRLSFIIVIIISALESLIQMYNIIKTNTALTSNILDQSTSFIRDRLDLIPLSGIGFTWVIPTVVVFLLAYIICENKKAIS